MLVCQSEKIISGDYLILKGFNHEEKNNYEQGFKNEEAQYAIFR